MSPDSTPCVYQFSLCVCGGGLYLAQQDAEILTSAVPGNWPPWAAPCPARQITLDPVLKGRCGVLREIGPWPGVQGQAFLSQWPLPLGTEPSCTLICFWCFVLLGDVSTYKLRG